MKKKGIWKKRAITVTMIVTLALLLGTFSPSFSENNATREGTVISGDDLQLEAFNEDIGTPYQYDTRPPDSDAAGMTSDQNDVGYHTDAGNNIYSSLPLYIGEPVDGTIPGCGRTGTLAPDDGDDCD